MSPRVGERDPAADRPRRVAFVVTRSDSVGGVQVCIHGLAVGLRAAGHEVEVFAGGDGPFAELCERDGVPVTRLRHMLREIDPLRDLRGLAELRRELQRFRPELISSHSTKAGWFARAVARRLGVANVYTAHGWAFGWQGGAKATIARGMEIATAPLADCIITVSEHDRRKALDAGVGRPLQVLTVHNAVTELEPGSALLADPGKQPARIVSVARLEAPKEPLLLLDALGDLAERSPQLDWELELIGDGPLRPAIETRLAQARGWGNRVHLLGTRDDVPQRLAEAQLFVLCSRHEGFPISNLEAMRAGLPVISSDVGGVDEAIERGINGELVPPGDRGAWTRALGELLADPAARTRMGSAGRTAFEARFNFELHLRRTWSVYHQALERHLDRLG